MAQELLRQLEDEQIHLKTKLKCTREQLDTIVLDLTYSNELHRKKVIKDLNYKIEQIDYQIKANDRFIRLINIVKPPF